MSYTLELNDSEISAINWVGHRYWNGDELMARLTIDWDSPKIVSGEKTYTCTITESAAWELQTLWEEEEHLIPCFSQDLCEKILRFLNSIV